MPGADALTDDKSRRQDIELITPQAELKAEVRRPGLAMVVAAARDGAIGLNGDMIWHLPGDLRYFKRLTMGGTVVMGRRTWQSLSKGALPGRRNVVISSNPDFAAPGAEVYPSLTEALETLPTEPQIFIIGGGRVYAEALPLAQTVYLTRIDAVCPEADTRFPALDPREWRLADASPTETSPKGINYHFETWVRR